MAALAHAYDFSDRSALMRPQLPPSQDDDFDLAERGGFPFRLLALGYGAGAALALGLGAAGWSWLAAAALGWFAGVAMVVAVPFLGMMVEDRLEHAKTRAREKAHRDATIEAWDQDLAHERVAAQGGRDR